MNISEYIIAVLALELTPGPNMAYLATLALSRGRIAGLVAVLGVACGLGLHALVAALGITALFDKFPLIYDALRWIGVGYLLYLAWDAWRPVCEASLDLQKHSEGTGAFFRQGFLSNVFNPKSVIFFISVVPNFVVVQPDVAPMQLQMSLLGGIYVAIATAIHASIVMVASQMRSFMITGTRRDVGGKCWRLLLVSLRSGWSGVRGVEASLTYSQC